LVCDQEGLLGKELFAIDGCKMSSNASKEWSGTFKELAEKRDKIQRQIRYWMSEHEKTDKESDDNSRRERIEKTVSTLNSAFDKIDQFLKTQSPRPVNVPFHTGFSPSMAVRLLLTSRALKLKATSPIMSRRR
ncbi:MAG: hypothetical protein ACPGYX_11910, partial [Oceanobacter sp.]